MAEFSSKCKGKEPEDEESSSTRQRLATTAKTSRLASSAKNKSKKRKRDDDLDYEFNDPHFESAKRLVQQAWVHAVRVDGTLIVLHSGNYELVCIRDRRSQTLYVSDVIEPPTYPEYGKLHIGIYIAAIQETIDRKKQRLKFSGDDDDLTGRDKDNQEDQSNGGLGSHHKGGGKHDEGSHGRRGVRERRGRRLRGSKFQGSARRLRSTDELVEVCWPEQCQSYGDADE